MAKCGYLAQNNSAVTVNASSAASGSITSATFATGVLTVNFPAISGWTPAAGQRVWITGQAAQPTNNGDYLVASSPTTGSITVANSVGVANATAQGTVQFSIPQTILAVKSTANFGWDLKKVELSFSGTSATFSPVLCELVAYTNATLGGTAIATPGSQIQNAYGPALAAGFTVSGPYTVEPTATGTVLDSWIVSSNQTTLIYDWPLGTTYDGPLNGTIALRITPTAFATSNATQVRASMLVERC